MEVYEIYEFDPIMKFEGDAYLEALGPSFARNCGITRER